MKGKRRRSSPSPLPNALHSLGPPPLLEAHRRRQPREGQRIGTNSTRDRHTASTLPRSLPEGPCTMKAAVVSAGAALLATVLVATHVGVRGSDSNHRRCADDLGCSLNGACDRATGVCNCTGPCKLPVGVSLPEPSFSSAWLTKTSRCTRFTGAPPCLPAPPFTSLQVPCAPVWRPHPRPSHPSNPSHPSHPSSPLHPSSPPPRGRRQLRVPSAHCGARGRRDACLPAAGRAGQVGGLQRVGRECGAGPEGRAVPRVRRGLCQRLRRGCVVQEQVRLTAGSVRACVAAEHSPMHPSHTSSPLHTSPLQQPVQPRHR